MKRISGTANVWRSPDFHDDHGLTAAQLDDVEMDIVNAEYDFSAHIVARTIQTPHVAPCGLHGPIMGDDPIPEDQVVYRVRGSRPYPSRLVNRLARFVPEITYICGWSKERARWELWTAFGGPLAPREPGDPSLVGDPEAADESHQFWAIHALSAPEDEA